MLSQLQNTSRYTLSSTSFCSYRCTLPQLSVTTILFKTVNVQCMDCAGKNEVVSRLTRLQHDVSALASVF